MKDGCTQFGSSSASDKNLHSFVTAPVRVTVSRLFALRSVVRTYSIIEIPRSQSFLDRYDIIRVWIALDHNLHSLAESSQLIPDISRPTQRFELQELLIAELLRIICIRPLLPYIQQREVVTARPHKVLTRLIRM